MAEWLVFLFQQVAESLVENIYILDRYYAKHDSGEQYKKRVSWLLGGTPLAVYEYKWFGPQVNQSSYVKMYPLFM